MKTTCSFCGTNQNAGNHRYCKLCKAKHMSQWRKTHPLSVEQKRRANCRSRAQAYRRLGKLIPQPCEACGDLKVEMHHPDYTKPLWVRWFCRKHHLAYHKQLKAAAVAPLVVDGGQGG